MKNKRTHTLTVGIPAYNEEYTIGRLVRSILRQKGDIFKLQKIIVVSDGSTDRTVSSVKDIKDARICVVANSTRKGRAIRQNQIIEETRSDILVLLDGDITIRDTFFLQKLILPITSSIADLTSCALTEYAPRNFFEEILVVSMKLKRILFQQIRHGQNIYTCYGPARAFSKRFYKTLHFKADDGEDMYSYIACRLGGYTFRFVPDTSVFYRLPSTLRDHCKQSIRYLSAQKRFRNERHEKFIEAELFISPVDFGVAAIKALPLVFTYPIHITLYVLIFCYVKIRTYFKLVPGDTWKVATSKVAKT